MNKAILHYPIGSFQRESNLLEQIKGLIADEAEQLLCCGSNDYQVLAILMNSYLTLIRAQGKDDTERTTHISEDLHTFAQQDKVTIVALSQLNRSGAGGNADMTSLRQSGQVEQDADGILLIQYNSETPEVREIKIVKNKEGLIGSIHASFDGDHQRFILQDSNEAVEADIPA